MGIKGIYKELGQGKRIALAKLAADSLESRNRPYRIAIDIAIWQFQNQAAQGGTNPAIRTLFYRLVRLLATPVQPIFVFDGPNKPLFKRNKRSGRGDGVATAMAKRLIRLFGFPVHDAPGEAEAECALLQRQKIVDAVLSEDVDTIMFGCTTTLRNWSSEGKTSKTPTHVSLYDVEDMALDREGMVLVALMSGGDYLPDGIPGCGVKVACEAAKAGFGKSICRLKASDKEGIQSWQKALKHELSTNEKNFFRTKHKGLVIPEDFPNLEVLRYYTHPVVSPASQIQAIRDKVEQKAQLHLEALREFARETFDWDYRVGAIKFIRVLGQALFTQQMIGTADARAIKRISGRRTHFSTDGTPELRVSFVPDEVVPIDLAKEADEDIPLGRSGLALNSDDEFGPATDAVEETRRAPKPFDVTKPDLAWILESLVKKSAPGAFEKWQERERNKTVQQSPKRKKKTGVSKSSQGSNMPHGSLDRFVRITKLSAHTLSSEVKPPRNGPEQAKPRFSPSKQSSPTRSSVRMSAIQAIDSSPVPPRSQEIQERHEAIYISSSPPAASAAPGSGKDAESIRSIFRAASSSQGVTWTQSRAAARSKQSSIDTFFTKVAATGPRHQTSAQEATGGLDSDSDLESLPSLTQPRPSATAPETLPKKKFYRQQSGFSEEVELDATADGADGRFTSQEQGRLIRHSDVSIIDLT